MARNDKKVFKLTQTASRGESYEATSGPAYSWLACIFAPEMDRPAPTPVPAHGGFSHLLVEDDSAPPALDGCRPVPSRSQI